MKIKALTIQRVRKMKTKLIIGAISVQLLVTQGIYADTPALEEVIVTAEKREQNLQDVPAVSYTHLRAHET